MGRGKTINEKSQKGNVYGKHSSLYQIECRSQMMLMKRLKTSREYSTNDDADRQQGGSIPPSSPGRFLLAPTTLLFCLAAGFPPAFGPAAI